MSIIATVHQCFNHYIPARPHLTCNRGEELICVTDIHSFAFLSKPVCVARGMEGATSQLSDDYPGKAVKEIHHTQPE